MICVLITFLILCWKYVLKDKKDKKVTFDVDEIELKENQIEKDKRKTNKKTPLLEKHSNYDDTCSE